MSLCEQDDRQLMVSLQSGEEAALDELIRRWERPLYSFAYRYTQNDALTRDVVQESFTRIYAKRERYDPTFPVSSWIFALAANICRNKARWRRRHPELSIDAPTSEEGESGLLRALPTDEPAPTENAQKTEELALLKRAVLDLPHDLRVAVLLHHYDELPYAEIAHVVGCSARGVETRLYRARKLLRARLDKALERKAVTQKKTMPALSRPATAPT